MGKRRNFSEDSGKRKMKNGSKERQKRGPKEENYEIIQGRLNHQHLPEEINSRDGATSATTSGNKLVQRNQRVKKRSKRAFSGNTKRIPLETNNKIRLPKIFKNQRKGAKESQNILKNKEDKVEVKSEVKSKNMISFTESQKESNKGK